MKKLITAILMGIIISVVFSSNVFAAGTCYKSATKSYNSTKKTYSSEKSNKKKLSGWDSYDKGYEDVWLDDDYDWDRYQRDSDYADGVDDAMEDWDW